MSVPPVHRSTPQLRRRVASRAAQAPLFRLPRHEAVDQIMRKAAKPPRQIEHDSRRYSDHGFPGSAKPSVSLTVAEMTLNQDGADAGAEDRRATADAAHTTMVMEKVRSMKVGEANSDTTT